MSFAGSSSTIDEYFAVVGDGFDEKNVVTDCCDF